MNEISSLVQTSTQNLFGTGSGILGKDDFLKILVTQLRNQNPLDPINGAEFASQLAQFSSVEQLFNISSNLEASIELDLLLNQAINNTMATTLIGKTVRAFGNSIAHIAGEKSTLNYTLSGAAKNVTLQIQDASGTTVRTIELSEQVSGGHDYEWDGKDDLGNEVAEGAYQFSVSATDIEGNSVTADTFVIGVIDSIRYQGGSAVLILGGIEVNLGSVVEIGFGQNNTSDESSGVVTGTLR